MNAKEVSQLGAPRKSLDSRRYLLPEVLASIGTLPFRARLIAQSAIPGSHRAHAHGAAVEFAEHKEYVPGDELRHLDWKVYAKQDRYYVRKYRQDSQLSATLLIDSSGSMAYRSGSLSKLRYGIHIAASMAYWLLGQGDEVGALSLLPDGAVMHVPRKSRRNHLYNLLASFEELERTGGKGATMISRLVEQYLQQSHRRRSLVLLISDMFERDESYMVPLSRLRALGHDVRILHLLDRAEIEFPFQGPTEFESLEGLGTTRTDASLVRRQYQERLQEFLSRCRTQCLINGFHYVQSATDIPFDRVMRQLAHIQSAP